jgi:hypothetical protein
MTFNNPIINIQGDPIPSPSGTNTVLTWSGSALSWAGGGSFTAAGDLSGTSTSQTVVSITGASGVVNIAATGNVITWAAATTAPGLSQATQTSDTATNSMTLAPQAPFASATSTNRNAGNLTIALPQPVSGGTESSFKITSFGNALITVNTDAIQSSGWAQILMPSSNQFVAGPSALQVNGGSQVQIFANSTGMVNVSNTGIQLGSVTAALGGGSKVIGLSNATVNPTTNPSGGLVLYGNGGTLTQRGSGGAQVDIAPPGSGTQNSQSGIINRNVAFFRTTTNIIQTAFTYTVPYSVTNGAMTLIEVQWTVRDTSGATSMVAAAGRWANAFITTSAGATSQVSNGTVTTSFTGSPGRNLTVYAFNNSAVNTFTAGVLTFTGSGSTIQLQVTAPTGNTYDWTFDIYYQNT